ncbi:flavodoxin domain-containing protein [Sessilibacter corallicola]|uniref:flavodoxin domain-containing protein n=1 Tax=Sessilibacter corallicola TaxID=2904075 RepID=UPI001E43679C|nr:flavodoxin domain-containing protein [Sessilibacter corallicola]MCE2028106.1 flavodoxin domain-containing protein [Sessilibacter corallicola]
MSSVLVVYGSVSGTAAIVAEEIVRELTEKDFQTELSDSSDVYTKIPNYDLVLVVTSTTGAGNFPDNIDGFYQELFQNKNNQRLTETQFSVLALGDTSFTTTYCRAGELFHDVFIQSGSDPILECFKLDACEVMDPVGAGIEWAHSVVAKVSNQLSQDVV